MAKQNPRMQHLSAEMPAAGGTAITGSAQALAVDGRGLLITGTGNIEFTTMNGSTITWNSIPVGIHGGITVRTIVSATATGYVLVD